MFAWLNERIKKLSVFDISCVKLSVFFATIIIVKLFPRLMGINYVALIILTAICAARPLCTIWIKR